MPDKIIETSTPFIYSNDENFTPQFLEYMRERARQNALSEMKRLEQEELERRKRRLEYRSVTFVYKVLDKITVYDDEGLQFGYIVRIKRVFRSTIIVIRLTDRRVVFAILPLSDNKEYRLPWLKYYSYAYTQFYLRNRYHSQLECLGSEGDVESYNYESRERIVCSQSE